MQRCSSFLSFRFHFRVAGIHFDGLAPGCHLYAVSDRNVPLHDSFVSSRQIGVPPIVTPCHDLQRIEAVTSCRSLSDLLIVKPLLQSCWILFTFFSQAISKLISACTGKRSRFLCLVAESSFIPRGWKWI